MLLTVLDAPTNRQTKTNICVHLTNPNEERTEKIRISLEDCTEAKFNTQDAANNSVQVWTWFATATRPGRH